MNIGEIATFRNTFNAFGGFKFKNDPGHNGGTTFSNDETATDKTWSYPAVTAASVKFAQITEAQTFGGVQTFSDGITVSGGSAANSSLWTASNVLRVRGGTSGFAIDNTSGTPILVGDNAGAWTLGPNTPTTYHTIKGALSIPTSVAGSIDNAAGSSHIFIYGDSNTERITILSSTPVVQMGGFGGTYASKTGVVAGTALGIVQAGGFDTSSMSTNRAKIVFYGDGTWSPTSTPTFISFLTTATTGSAREVGSVNNTGAWTLGPAGLNGTHTLYGTTAHLVSNAASSVRYRVETTKTSGDNVPGFELYNENTFKGGLFYNETNGFTAFYGGVSGTYSVMQVTDAGVLSFPMGTATDKASCTAAGAWTFPVSINSPSITQDNSTSGSARFSAKAKNDTAYYASLDLYTGTSLRWQIGSGQSFTASGAVGADSLFIYSSVGVLAQASPTGMWTLGSATGADTITHIVYGYEGTSGVVASFRNRAITNSGYITVGGSSTQLNIGCYAGNAYFEGVYGKAADTANGAVYVGSNNKLNTNTSIRESKANIASLTFNTLPEILRLIPVTYNRKIYSEEEEKYTNVTEPQAEIGLIAEDILENNPNICDLVLFKANGKLKGIHYDRLPVLLIKAIQELAVKNDILVAKTEALEARIGA